LGIIRQIITFLALLLTRYPKIAVQRFFGWIKSFFTRVTRKSKSPSKWILTSYSKTLLGLTWQ